MNQQWKVGNEFLPYHPDASHVDPNYRQGWNDCYHAAAFGHHPVNWEEVDHQLQHILMHSRIAPAHSATIMKELHALLRRTVRQQQ
jgi:hypothetical protein